MGAADRGDKRGNAVCEMKHGIPLKDADRANEGALRTIFTPDAIEKLIRIVVEAKKSRPDTQQEERERIGIEIARVEAELARLVAAIARGLDSPTVVDEIKDRERALADARARLEHHDRLARVADKWRDPKWLAKVQKAIEQRRAGLKLSPAVARQILRRTFTREGISLTPSLDGGKVAWEFAWNYEDIFNESETPRERTLT